MSNHYTSRQSSLINRLSKLLVASLTLCLLTASCGEQSGKKDKVSADSTSVASSVKTESVSTPDTGIVTIAAIRKSNDGKSTELLFNERASIYILSATDKDYPNTLKMLEQNLRNQIPFRIITSSDKKSIATYESLSVKTIDSIKMSFKTNIRATLPEKLLRFDSIAINRVPSIDTSRLLGCTSVIPNYATALTIFKYCAAQTCSIVTPPPTVNPCIPFQYVRDGCYARAHKMKWIIENKYKYCLQKVFSFANTNNNQLAVKANKWGGCCVTWWYHVAPLVQVKMGGITLPFVIDPGMFDEPVLLSVWLQAQANKSCSPQANVSSYSIQPAAAYAPANYQGTAFTIDPYYIYTNQTLTAYRNLRTCP